MIDVLTTEEIRKYKLRQLEEAKKKFELGVSIYIYRSNTVRLRLDGFSVDHWGDTQKDLLSVECWSLDNWEKVEDLTIDGNSLTHLTNKQKTDFLFSMFAEYYLSIQNSWLCFKENYKIGSYFNTSLVETIQS